MRVFGTQYFIGQPRFRETSCGPEGLYNQANLQHFNFDSEESKPGETKLSLDFPGCIVSLLLYTRKGDITKEMRN